MPRIKSPGPGARGSVKAPESSKVSPKPVPPPQNRNEMPPYAVCDVASTVKEKLSTGFAAKKV